MHTSLWILTFVALFKSLFLPQTRDKLLIYLSQEFSCWLHQDQVFSWCLLLPLQIQKLVHTLGPCISRASGSLHPSISPSLIEGAPPAALCMITFASICIRSATLVSHHHHSVLWQAPEDTERLFLFVQVQLALMFCWFKVFSSAFSKDPVRSAGTASWEVKLQCMYL